MKTETVEEALARGIKIEKVSALQEEIKDSARGATRKPWAHKSLTKSQLKVLKDHDKYIVAPKRGHISRITGEDMELTVKTILSHPKASQAQKKIVELRYSEMKGGQMCKERFLKAQRLITDIKNQLLRKERRKYISTKKGN